jgi:hypothetical protein
MAGCPKCSRDLIDVNPHKPTVTYPNGFVTFSELRVGETLNLPEKWWSKWFDELPPEYFKSLPHPDGVTPSKLGDLASGALGGYERLEIATLEVNALASMDDRKFNTSANNAASSVDISVVEARVSDNTTAVSLAQSVRSAIDSARQHNASLKTALDAGDQTKVVRERLDTQNALLTALGAARITLEVLYSTPTPTPTPVPAPIPAPKPPVLKPRPAPTPAPEPIVVAPTQSGVSAAGLFGYTLIGVGLVGGSIYLATHRPWKKRTRRAEKKP